MTYIPSIERWRENDRPKVSVFDDSPEVVGVEVSPLLGITIRLRGRNGVLGGVGFSALRARDLRDELNRAFPPDGPTAKVAEVVAYQCGECGRKHLERDRAERCCRCHRCGGPIKAGSIGHCPACAEAYCVETEADDAEADDAAWLDSDED